MVLIIGLITLSIMVLGTLVKWYLAGIDALYAEKEQIRVERHQARFRAIALGDY